jgi:hypothetical protein
MTIRVRKFDPDGTRAQLVCVSDPSEKRNTVISVRASFNLSNTWSPTALTSMLIPRPGEC